MERYARFDERYHNPLWADDPADYLLVTSKEWKRFARDLLICALEAYGKDIPDDIMCVVENYFRDAFDAEERERGRRACRGDD